MDAPSAVVRPMLLQQAEKILLEPINPHLLSYCPSMDLIAVVSATENLDVYRINGQRAFGLKRKSEDVHVDALAWEFNGKSIAVAWSDGATDLVSAETGKVTHRELWLPGQDDEEKERVGCIGWGLNFIDVDAVKRRTGVMKDREKGASTVSLEPVTDDWDTVRDDTTLEDFLQRQPDLQALDVAPDLPDQLAMMDVEALLPKLPAIPLPPVLPFMRVSPADAGAFGSQAEVDALLHSHHLKDHNSVDMFIRCSQRGRVHPSIYDSKETVSVGLPAAWEMESTPLLHTSHPYGCSHGLLMRVSSSKQQREKLAFVPLTLNFIPSAGIYLHLIASKTAQLQNLLLYITQCLQRIRTFFKHSQDLPAKFMMNISETLEEKHQGDLVTNLFHLAFTGNCPPLVREWLVDELAEQGHKRWDNTVTTSYNTLLALVHENLIPALDRCSIVISRLRGLAQYHDRTWIFSAPVSDFTALLESLRKMRLLAHTVQLYANDEKRQFASFSKWLRFCIDFEATEPESTSRIEMEARDPGVDIAMVLEYIQYGLTKSDLTPYLLPEAQLSKEQRSSEVASYEDTRRAIELLKEGAMFKPEGLCLEHVLGHLTEGTTRLLRQVSQWQENNIQMDSGVVLEDEASDEGVADMRMVFDTQPPTPPAQETDISTFILLTTPSTPHLHIHRLTHAPTLSSLPRDLHAHTICTLDFAPASAKLLDAKFADDETLVLLLTTAANSTEEAQHVLVAMPYTNRTTDTDTDTDTDTPNLITYSPPTPAGTDASPRLLPFGSAAPASLRHRVRIDAAAVRAHTRHVFEAHFTPLRLVVNGRKGRRVVVVLGSDRRHYRVLDLDYGEERARDVDGEEEEGEEEEGDVEMGGA